MATLLGTVSLSDELVLSGLDNRLEVATTSRRTIGGRLLTRSTPAPGGAQLSLDGEHHFTIAQVAAVQALAALGQPVTLVHHRGTYTVLITGLEMEPSINYANPVNTDWLSGRILLLEV